MSSNRIKNYQHVKELVLQGVTSPSVIVDNIPLIKNWRTAKKYVDEAIDELSKSDTATKEMEYFAMKEGLKTLKGTLLSKIKKTRNANQYIGAVKQLLKVNAQMIKLMQLDQVTDAKTAEWNINITTAKPRKLKSK